MLIDIIKEKYREILEQKKKNIEELNDAKKQLEILMKDDSRDGNAEVKLREKIESLIEIVSQELVFDLGEGSIIINDNDLVDFSKTPIDGDFIFHRTSFFPKDGVILSSFDGDKKTAIKINYRGVTKNVETVYPRHTVHFTHNGIVTRNTGGDWTNKPFIIVDDYSEHMEDFANPYNPNDHYVDGSLKLSSKSLIIIDINFKEEVEKSIDLSKFNVVYFNGDLDKCFKNFMEITGIAHKRLEMSNAAHYHSKYMAQEKCEFSRNVALKFLNINPSVINDTQCITKEDFFKLIDFFMEQGNNNEALEGNLVKYPNDDILLYRIFGKRFNDSKLQENEVIAIRMMNYMYSLGIKISESGEFTLMTYSEMLERNADDCFAFAQDFKENHLKLVGRFKEFKKQLDELSPEELEKFLNGDTRNSSENTQR